MLNGAEPALGNGLGEGCRREVGIEETVDRREIRGVKQPELYTYTVALMLLGAVLLYQAIAAKSVLLRRIAMGVIAITVAKVFLLDASGLTGLTRVISFAGLGLSLAGLAWLNRWAGQVSEK